jgi:uncharacterized protein
MGADNGVLVPVKIVIAGGLGAGKSTMVATISEIEPLITEGEGIDVGRVTFEDGAILFLLGTPGELGTPGDLLGTPGPDRFGHLWDDLTKGALGAVVLVDSRHIDACFAALDELEARNLPFVVAVNMFDGLATHHPRQVREALSVPANVPIVLCDARRKSHVQETLVLLVESALRRAQRAAG